MKRSILLIISLIIACFYCSTAFAFSIATSASGNFFGDSYGYTFTIDDEGTDDGIFAATLTNTSDASIADALIDLLAFNMDAEIGTDFTIENIVPDWTFAEGSGGVQFDYIGSGDTPSDRLAPGEVLAFDFIFLTDFSDPLSLWTDTEGSLGRGIGGGQDFGQVAVSFQQLGLGGRESDLLASDWNDAPAPVPEPATMLLLGTGLAGLAGFGRKKLTK